MCFFDLLGICVLNFVFLVLLVFGKNIPKEKTDDTKDEDQDRDEEGWELNERYKENTDTPEDADPEERACPGDTPGERSIEKATEERGEYGSEDEDEEKCRQTETDGDEGREESFDGEEPDKVQVADEEGFSRQGVDDM